jgi:hypothetical protein
MRTASERSREHALAEGISIARDAAARARLVAGRACVGAVWERVDGAGGFPQDEGCSATTAFGQTGLSIVVIQDGCYVVARELVEVQIAIKVIPTGISDSLPLCVV